MWRKRAKRVAQSMGAFFVLLFGVMVAKASLLSSRQPVVAPLSDPTLDARAAAGRLSLIVQQQTISESTTAPTPAAELAAMRTQLEQGYPKVHTSLVRELVGEHSLLYAWKAEGSAKPIILCAHQDVVPIEAGTEGKWQRPPFSGLVDEQFVWGR